MTFFTFQRTLVIRKALPLDEYFLKVSKSILLSFTFFLILHHHFSSTMDSIIIC
ncbi:unnamed protein product [Arabidopsis halleri]